MGARIKVFLVLECGSPYGVGRQVATLCRNLDAARFEPWVVYAVRAGCTAGEFERLTASAHRHVHIPQMVREVRPFQDLAAFWKLYRLMRRERPDVVHAHSSKAGVLARAAAWLAGVPRIYYTPHGYSFLQTDAGALRRRTYWLMERSVSWIGNIVACSREERVQARRLSWGREVYHVHILFALQALPPAPGRGDDGSLRVGAVGRLSPARDPGSFLRLAQRLSATHPQARFVWLGGGELEAGFRREVARLGLQEKLEVTGDLPHEDLLKRLAGLDVFVHYSRWEGSSIALHEALALAKPVVASAVPGNCELVVPGVTGCLARSEDELWSHVSRLLASAELRARLGRNGKAWLAREVSLEVSLRELERLYSA
jgi:glycosyltransferase involved in cell wall biosynthesis